MSCCVCAHSCNNDVGMGLVDLDAFVLHLPDKPTLLARGNFFKASVQRDTRRCMTRHAEHSMKLVCSLRSVCYHHFLLHPGLLDGIL